MNVLLASVLIFIRTRVIFAIGCSPVLCAIATARSAPRLTDQWQPGQRPLRGG